MNSNSITIGTCSICGGAVTIPRVWMSVVPARPHCSHCGAVPKAHGPVIPMRPPSDEDDAFLKAVRR